MLDALGCLHQFLPPQVQPLRPDMVVLGRAMPVLEADYDTGMTGRGGQTPTGAKPFGLMLEALDDLKPNEVYVASGGTPAYALWGELMSTRALHLGATLLALGLWRLCRSRQVLSGRTLAALDHGVLSRNPTGLDQALEERLVECIGADGGADPGDPPRRLRLGGERRGEESARQSADERPPVHHAIT